MPSVHQKYPVSLGELAICEDFLNSHREYAVDLLSSVEKIRQGHGVESCLETRGGRTCTVCELCSVDGLMGAAKSALMCYDEDAKRLHEVRVSLGKSARGRGPPSRETLLKSNPAKFIFLSTVSVGDALRSQHATWQARLQSEVTTLPLSVRCPNINTGLGDSDESRKVDIWLPTYSGPTVIAPQAIPKSTAAATSSAPDVTYVVFRRCLSSDCPCEANRAGDVSNTNARGTHGSQVTSKAQSSASGSRKTRTSKGRENLEPMTWGSVTRLTTTNLERRARGTSGELDPPAKARTDARIQMPSTYHDLDGPGARTRGAQRPQGVTPVEHEPSSPRPETVLLTWQEVFSSESSPSPECGTLIVDPRVLRLREAIAQCDDVCRRLVEWCEARMAELRLDPPEKHRSGSEVSLAHGPTMKGTRGYPPTLAHTIQVGEAVQDGLPSGDEASAQELRFDSEQDELERRWLMARRNRYKDQKRRRV